MITTIFDKAGKAYETDGDTIWDATGAKYLKAYSEAGVVFEKIGGDVTQEAKIEEPVIEAVVETKPKKVKATAQVVETPVVEELVVENIQE